MPENLASVQRDRSDHSHMDYSGYGDVSMLVLHPHDDGGGAIRGPSGWGVDCAGTGRRVRGPAARAPEPIVHQRFGPVRVTGTAAPSTSDLRLRCTRHRLS